MLQIVSFDFTLNYSLFENIVNDTIADESSRTGISFDFKKEEAHLKSSKNVYKLTFTNLDSSNTIEVIALKIGNDISFKPLEIRNYNDSFYKMNYYDDDLTYFVSLTLKKSAIKAKGSFGCIIDGQSTLVQNGRDMSTHVVGMALIDDSGKVYNLKSVDIDVNDEDDEVGYVPKYLINDWIDEYPMIQEQLNNVTQAEKFELIAQLAIYQKRKGMINANQFRDIFIQAGGFADMIGGFKDETVKNIYQFFI